MIFMRNAFLMILAVLLVSCNRSAQGPSDDLQVSYDVTYAVADDDFCNPERGFYRQYTLWFRDGVLPSPVSVQSLRSDRLQNRTLTLSLFYLTDFMDGDISDAALDVIRQSLDAHREAGMKAILRFAYKDSYSEESAPWDAPVDVVLRHVAQLKPVFNEYEDVIYVLQAGFVGAWGEWYYTSHFNFDPQTDEDWQPRIRLIRALLDAVPESRQIALRTPLYKMKFFGTEKADSITAAVAYDGSDLSRIAGHNDCFISSSNDVGTFTSQTERELWKGDTQYCIMGGETCAAIAAYCDCPKAFRSLEDYHWSYLNSGYHAGVLSMWKTNGCFNEISRRLGYRLCLVGADFGDSFSAGKEFKVDLTLRNDGFASVMNEHPVEFVIAEKDAPSSRQIFTTGIDPRVWKAGGTYRISEDISLPSSICPGKEYNLYMNIPDASGNLRDNPAFSIRLANENVWGEATGYNLIGTFTAE